MTKSFIALKTTKNGRSIWATNPVLCQTYHIGARVRCQDPLFPFFICSEDSVGYSNIIHCGAPYDAFNIIQVFANELTHITPWVNAVSEPTLALVRGYNMPNTLASFKELYHPRQYLQVSHNFAAQRVKVLDRLPKDRCVMATLKCWSKQLHIPILSIDKYLKLHPKCERA